MSADENNQTLAVGSDIKTVYVKYTFTLEVAKM